MVGMMERNRLRRAPTSLAGRLGRRGRHFRPADGPDEPRSRPRGAGAVVHLGRRSRRRARSEHRHTARWVDAMGARFDDLCLGWRAKRPVPRMVASGAAVLGVLILAFLGVALMNAFSSSGSGASTAPVTTAPPNSPPTEPPSSTSLAPALPAVAPSPNLLPVAPEPEPDAAPDAAATATTAADRPTAPAAASARTPTPVRTPAPAPRPSPTVARRPPPPVATTAATKPPRIKTPPTGASSPASP